MFKRYLLIFLCFSTSNLWAQVKQEPKHPIDLRLEKCLSIEANQTTLGMMNCEDIAAKEWDKELNKYYQLMMKRLNSEQQNLLRSAQRAWLDYREKELAFYSQMYLEMGGSMWRVIAAGRFTDMIRVRTLELKAYYENLTLGE